MTVMEDNVWGDLRKQWTRGAAREAPDRERWAQPYKVAMDAANDAYAALWNAGWRDAIYCPKDGSMFLAWSPSSRTPYKCRYEGEWPKGSWWAYVDGDVWPDRPVLWCPLPKEDT